MITTTQTPHTPTTGKDFTRGNATRLVEAETEFGYPTSEWATYRQWIAAGRQVRKGEQGVKCLLPKVQRTDDGTEVATGRIVRGFHVFNISQTDSIN
jgi:antirestriction protein ArdC